MYAKMLQETEAEETIVFVTFFFIIGGISVGGQEPLPPSYGYPYALSVALILNELQQMSSRRVAYPSSTEIQTAGGA